MRLPIISIAGVCLLFVTHIDTAHALDDPSNKALLDALRSEWRTRTEKFNSVKFKWKESRKYYAGSFELPGSASATEDENNDAKRGWPKKIEFPRMLMLRGKWMKHVSRTVGLGPANLAQTDYASGYDGKSSRILLTNGEEMTGSIRDEDRNMDAPADSLRPLMYFVRPFDKEVGMVDPASLKIVSRNENDGHLVVQANAKRRFVVDPDRGFLIVRWEQGNPALGGNLKQGRIEYQNDDRLGWIPARWHLDCFAPDDPNKLLRQHAGVVTDVEAGTEYGQSQFRVEFPAGAQIYDHHTSEVYIILEDGSKLDVSLFKKSRRSGRTP